MGSHFKHLFKVNYCLGGSCVSVGNFVSHEVTIKERIVLREIHLRTTGCHLSMGSHSVICHPTEVTAPHSPQPDRLVLDLSTP